MTIDKPPSQNALKRLIFFLVAAAVLILFSYGWTVTNIDLSVPQQQQRQTGVQNALRELLSPNIFTQNYEVTNYNTSFLVECGDATGPEQVTLSGEGYITVEPACGTSGDILTVHGYGFPPNALSQLRWVPLSGTSRPRTILGTTSDRFNTNVNGEFTVQIEVPRIAGSTGETHQIQLGVAIPEGAPYLSTTTNEVVTKMIETIFLALIATVISILPSVILSFFAAHNLMRPVHLRLGNMLVMVCLFPVGWWIGSNLLATVGSLGLQIFSGNGIATAAAGTGLIFATVATSRRPSLPAERGIFASIIRSLIIAVLIIVVIGVIGGLATLLGNFLEQRPPIGTYLGNFIGTIGEVIRLAMPLIGGAVGAFVLTSIGSKLVSPYFKRVSVVPSHILGLILGTLSGAIILGAAASVALFAAYLAIIPPVIAAYLGAQVLPLIYRVGTKNNAPNSYLKSILTLVGAVIAFLVTFAVLNVRQSLVEGTIPSLDGVNLLGLNIPYYVLYAGIIGAILGGIICGLSGIRANFPIGSVLYNLTRTILNILRSIEPLIMGIVFVIWVGIGPFAGVLALTLHSIASLGKLYSEQLENIDQGPIEALESTGANQVQTIMYGAVPQIIPPYIAFTMYRWDINVRMSTIIGFVGGGGIGFLLNQQLNLLRYRDAGVAVLAIAIVVSILDYASASIRERYM